MRTLLLSANYVPLRAIPWESAIKMRYEGTAEVIEEYTELIRSPSVTWRIPAVMRERRHVRVKHGVRFSPLNVFRRDGFRCQYCGETFPREKLECEHVVPKSHGGKRNWENIVAACRACNALKGDRECDQIGMFPLSKPVRPRSLPTGVYIDPDSAPPEWLPYLIEAA